MSLADALPLMSALGAACEAAGDINLELATPNRWAAACHYLFEAGEVAVLDHVVPLLHAAFPRLPFLNTLKAFFDGMPRSSPPAIPFKDDPPAQVQVLRRPDCEATLLC